MNVGHVKALAREWVESNRSSWPGLRAAHLVGGITVMPDDAPFPDTKDVDFHLIFAADSPMLQQGPFLAVIATTHCGLLIEAGIKSEMEYASPEAVLANPEIAHHLTVDSAIYDPDGLLAGLRERVTRDFARPEWVRARVEHERKGFEGAVGLYQMARGAYGQSGEANVLGYLTTFLVAALQIASLEPVKLGGQMLVRGRTLLERLNRLDTHEEILDLLGTRQATREQVERYLAGAAATFDLAVAVKRTPHPFEHKMHAHLRPYFIDSCAAMTADGNHREALCWLTPCICAGVDVIVADGDEADKARFVALREELLHDIGFDSPDAGDRKLSQAMALAERVFALADELIAANPRITD